MSETSQRSLTAAKDDLVREKVPYDASPQYIEEIAGTLTHGAKTSNEVSDTLDYSSGLIRRNLRFGVELGFFVESNDSFELTERGKTLGHMGLSEDTEWVFQDAVKNYPFYRQLIELLLKSGSVTEVRGKPSLPQEEIRSCINGPLQFELGDRVLTGAVRTFMRTLDAAGYGQYVRGDGDYPTRIVLDESITEFGNIHENSEKESLTDEPDESKSDSEVDETKVQDNFNIDYPESNFVVEVSVEISEDSDSEKLAERVHEFERLYEKKRKNS